MAAAAAAAPEAKVSVLRLPGGGLQPQAVTDAQGVVHVVYLGGDGRASDVFYAKLMPGTERFTTPMRVNSKSGDASAAGTIRGAQIALGRNGRVHVAWNGGRNAEPAPVDAKYRSPMLYTRMNDAGTAFEPERNVLLRTMALDGGGCVAADTKGNVIVTWHAGELGAEAKGESGRGVYVARSADEGKTFSPEERIAAANTGACGCCGMKALADSRGGIHLLYRTAKSAMDRDMTWLTAENFSAPFRAQPLEAWRIGACPMSSESLVESGGKVFAAWETAQQVRFAELGAGTPKLVAPPGAGKRKHPALARNAAGVTLFAWSEDTTFNKGGSVAWQLFDSNGQPVGEPGRGADLPKWSLPAAAARAGGFVVLY
ncbi:MAG: hypothetical protein HY301_18805 [Verrucomicrobia bacterium]|nr:hypothetical protein [Verrucomicrobiota bacterium]